LFEYYPDWRANDYLKIALKWLRDYKLRLALEKDLTERLTAERDRLRTALEDLAENFDGLSKLANRGPGINLAREHARKLLEGKQS
jgi:hypothetical protein